MITFNFQTDNGEFKSAKCRGYIKSCTGQLITNAPYSPETMAIVEKSWRTIDEMASVMLLTADLCEEFWEEAANYAVTIHLQLIPPFKPDPKDLRVSPYEKVCCDLMPFGCRGCVLLNVYDKNHRWRSHQLIYMGRGVNSIGGDRFYHPPSQHFGNRGQVAWNWSLFMILSSLRVLGWLRMLGRPQWKTFNIWWGLLTMVMKRWSICVTTKVFVGSTPVGPVVLAERAPVLANGLR